MTQPNDSQLQKGVVFLLVLSLLTLLAPPAGAQELGHEPLLEVPLHKIPKGLTFEDYEDANRRAGMARLYGIIPGGVHFYANECTSGWILSGSALAGLAAIFVGATAMTEEVPPAFPTTTIDGNTFLKKPIITLSEDGSETTTYELTAYEAKKEPTAAGGAMIGLGVATIVGVYFWDILHGISVIEEKRNRARYKIGQMLNKQSQYQARDPARTIVKLAPLFIPERGATGLQLQLQF